MSGRAFRERLDAKADGRLLLDVGTSSLTGVRIGALRIETTFEKVANPIYEMTTLAAKGCRTLGSDFQRAGYLFAPPELDAEDLFVDSYGVGWLWADGYPAQAHHPLEKASWGELSGHARPETPHLLQIGDPRADQQLVIADAPCPGLLDTCFALRNAWQFLNDLTDDWRCASALLDWALETTAVAYERLLSELPQPPDVVVYADDLGFRGAMYLSDTDFRNHIYPRLKTLVSRIRRATPAAICLHSCGSIRSILPDLASLDVELLNLDFHSKGMVLTQVRRELPDSVVLHGPVDMVVLGQAARDGDRALLASLAEQIADSLPAVMAPSDYINTRGDLDDAIRGAAMLRSLEVDDLESLERIGPSKGLIQKMLDAARFQPNPLDDTDVTGIALKALHAGPSEAHARVAATSVAGASNR